MFNNVFNNNTNFVVIKVIIGRQTAVVLYANQQKMQSIRITTNHTNQLLYSHHITKECGNYYQNDTDNSLYFILTDSCIVYFKMEDSIKVNIRLQTDFHTFIRTEGLDHFLQQTASVLNIDQSRLIITKYYDGSVVIDFYITPEDSIHNTSSNQEVNHKVEAQNQKQDYQTKQNNLNTLNALSQTLQEAVQTNKLDLGVPITDFTYKLVVLPFENPVGQNQTQNNKTQNTNSNNEQSDSKYIIIIVTIITFIVITIIVALIVCRVVTRKRRNIVKRRSVYALKIESEVCQQDKDAIEVINEESQFVQSQVQDINIRNDIIQVNQMKQSQVIKVESKHIQ